MRTQVPVSNLEVTIKVNSFEPAKPRILPHFVNVADPAGTRTTPAGSVRSTARSWNDTSPQTLTLAKLSIVLLDADRQDRRRRHRDDVLAAAVGIAHGLPRADRFQLRCQISAAVTWAIVSMSQTYTSA